MARVSLSVTQCRSGRARNALGGGEQCACVACHCSGAPNSVLDAMVRHLVEEPDVSETGGGVRMHLVGGPHDGQMVCGASLQDVMPPQGYRMTPWPGGPSGIHWHQELNLACVHGALAADELYAALGAQWRTYLTTRRQQVAAGKGGDARSGCVETVLA